MNDRLTAQLKDKKNWPVVTASVRLPMLGQNGSIPVRLGVGMTGRQVGYYSGGTHDHGRGQLELWLRLDPAELVRMVGIDPDAPAQARDAQIIVDQERTIARLRSEVRGLEDRAIELQGKVCEWFNPPDDDSTDELAVIERAAEFIASLPCFCTPEQIEDHDACERCKVLGRIGDKSISR